jgi:hypothetical protein
MLICSQPMAPIGVNQTIYTAPTANVVGPTWDASGANVIYSYVTAGSTAVNVIATPLTAPTQTEIDTASGAWIDFVDGPLTFSPDGLHAAYGHTLNTPAYGVFVDLNGVLLNSVPFGLAPFGPGNLSIDNVSYPSWGPK